MLQRAIHALLPFYRHVVPRRVRVAIPHRLRKLIGRWANPPTYAYSKWIAKNDTLRKRDLSLIVRHIASLKVTPKLSIVMPVFDPPVEYLREAIDSVLGQLYQDWELCIADDASTNSEIKNILTEYASRDMRIRVTYRDANGGISTATNAALAMASGDWISLMDHDDTLSKHALYLVAEAINAHPDAAILYSDEDRIAEDGTRLYPHFKADWDYDLLLGQNYICHLATYRADLARKVRFRDGFDGSQDWDFALRVLEAAPGAPVHHIPFVLYHWRLFETSFSNVSLERARATGLRAVREHLARTGVAATTFPEGHSSHIHFRLSLPTDRPLVSVIIPTKDKKDLLNACIDGLLHRTNYSPIEIVIVDNGSKESDARAYIEELRSYDNVHVINDYRPFNFSRLINRGVAASSGFVCVLLNNDTAVINPDWLDEMVSHAIRPDVGAVGAKLFYADDVIQHGGVILGLDGVAIHVHKGAPRSAEGYLNRLNLTHNLSCVTGACLATRRNVFDEVGGFNEQDLTVAFNDVDFCIRIRQANYKIIWTPHAQLYHFESKSRGSDAKPENIARYRDEIAYMRRCWGPILDNDPFYNPNFSLYGVDYALDKSRVRKPWRRTPNLPSGSSLEPKVSTLRLSIKARLRRLLGGRDAQIIEASGLFDHGWYLAVNKDVREAGTDPVVHYLEYGASEGRNPSPLFDSKWYLEKNSDVRQHAINPLLHYIKYGAAEGRSPNPGVRHSVRTADQQHVLPDRLIYISGEWKTPGNHYRVLRHVEAARLAGAEASWMRLDEVPERVDELSRATIVVIWRAAWNDHTATAVAAARRAGARLVFDVDDLMIKPDIARKSIIDGIRTQGLTEEAVREHYARVRRTMLEADICTATTEELAWYMRLASKPTFVLPNGYDSQTLDASRLAVRRRRQAMDDGLIRIGYASGSHTHQRDFAGIAGAVARVLRERPHCRLVLFQDPRVRLTCLDTNEFRELTGLENQVEWREFVPLERLPAEMARFDVNLAPLEVENPFCEAKSELKYFEAALVDVVTIASPTGPLRRAIRDGETGFLASNQAVWYDVMLRLVADPALRQKVAQSAKYDAMRQFGPTRRVMSMASFIAQLNGGRESAYAFAQEVTRLSGPAPELPKVPKAQIVFESDHLRTAEVTVIVPLYNYAKFITEALESVLSQTLDELDLIVIDDCSTDDSLAISLDWAKRNASRFNRLLILQNESNSRLGPSRNVGFDAAETHYVLPLDADNRLFPNCCEHLLAALKGTDILFAYPIIRKFGDCKPVSVGNVPYEPMRLVAGNYIDAMALVSKEAWAYVGGYDNVDFGWEDFDLWCRFAENGLRGTWVGETLAEYRVHSASMLRTTTERPQNKRLLLDDMSRRHNWLALVERKRD